MSWWFHRIFKLQNTVLENERQRVPFTPGVVFETKLAGQR